MGDFRILCYGIVAASVLLSWGCAPSTTKPDGASVRIIICDSFGIR